MCWESVIISIAVLSSATAAIAAAQCGNHEVPIVRKISEIEDADSFPGVSHLTLAGSLSHGLKEVEVWLETMTPGAGSPIHSHPSEEIIVVLKGSGTLYLATAEYSSKYPGEPKEFPFFANSTFHIHANDVHQLRNTNESEDLHLIVVISRPPLKPFLHHDWFMPQSAAKLIFPLPWDAQCYQAPPLAEDEL